nr:unnamed protein product [Callosobruchus analis]
MSFNILNVGEHALNDSSIVSCEHHSHPPYANTTFNKSDEIRIPIQTQEIYTLPTNSTLYFEGRLVNQEGKVSATLSFVNNFIAFLFDEIRYEIGGTVVDRVRNPGITSTLKGLVSFTSNECERYQHAGWSHLQNPTVVHSTGGYFSVNVPLRNLLGCFEDFKKILINIRQELVLIRSTTDLNSIITANAQEKSNIELTKVLWRMPHVQVADVEKLRLLKYIEKGRDLEIAFRSWELHEYPLLQQTTKHTWNVKATNQMEKPRYVIFALQTDRKNNSVKDMSQFDHCYLAHVKLYLNSDMYPYDNVTFIFEKSHVSLLYEMFASFQQSYYYKQSSEPCLNLKQFIERAPMVVIDCSRQNESLKSGSVDIRLEFETQRNIPANTTAFCLIIHDRLIRYNPLTSTVKTI